MFYLNIEVNNSAGYNSMTGKINELVFRDRAEMAKQMECSACEYEGYVPGRNGYNFPNKDGSYTVAYVKGDILTKRHEMCHARYYFDANYRKEVERLWLSLSDDEKNTVESFLAKCGYRESVWMDEFAAYWYTEKDPRRFFGLRSGEDGREGGRKKQKKRERR